MSIKKKGLGKGLSALVEETIVNPLIEITPDLEQLKQVVSSGNNGVLMVSPSKVLPSRYQPRKEFDEAFLEELSDSIRKHGIIQPLVVSELGDGSYELVAGERRLRASKMAGLIEVPVVVREFPEKDRLAVALIENIQRADLNAIEVAEAYQEMIDRVHLTQDEVSVIVGKSRTSVANTLRLLKLPESIRKRIVNNNISEGHGRAILSLYPDFTKMEEVARLAEENDLSVRQTEEMTRKILSVDTSKKDLSNNSSVIDDKLQALEEKLVKTLGIKTKVSGNIGKGSVSFYYHTKEELENLIQNILQNKDSY